MFVGGRDFFRRPEVKSAIALLRCAYAPEDDQSHLRLMTLPRYFLGAGRILIAGLARKRGVSIRSLATEIAELAISPGERSHMQLLFADCEALALLSNHSDAYEVLMEALERSRYVGLLDGPNDSERLIGAACLRKLAEIIETFARENGGADVESCVRHLELLEAAEDLDDVPYPVVRRDVVRLSTIHGAKGLEFPHVFVVELTNGEFPGREITQRLQLPAELVFRDEALLHESPEEEQRRLFYVALTRAIDSLTVTYSHRDTYGRAAEPSEFLTPLLANQEVIRVEAPAAALADTPPMEEAPPAFEIGEFSYSHIQTFQRCPRRYAYAYYWRFPEREEGPAVLGKLVHEVLYHASIRRMRGEPMGAAALNSISDDVWQHAEVDRRRFRDLEGVARQMLTTYAANDRWTTANVAAAENSFAGLPVGPYRFRGSLDRLDHVDGGLVVVDYKTGSPKILDQMTYDDRLQLALYVVAAQRNAGGGVPVAAEFHYLRNGTVLEVPLSDQQISSALWAAQNRAEEITRAVNTREFPTKASKWNCRGCGYRTVCDEGATALAGDGPDEAPVETHEAEPGEIPF